MSQIQMVTLSISLLRNQKNYSGIIGVLLLGNGWGDISYWSNYHVFITHVDTIIYLFALFMLEYKNIQELS